MQIRRVWVLRGGNHWARTPVLEVELDLDGFAPTPEFIDRLHTGFPSFPSTLHPAEFVGRLAVVFQTAIGSQVRFIAVKPMPAGFRVVFEYEEEALGKASLEAALDMCHALLADSPFDVATRLVSLRELAYSVRLGPSTGSIVNAARRRGIPIRRLTEGSLVAFGHGIHQRRIWTAETDRTGTIAEAVAQDKQLTRFLLERVGVPVPSGRAVVDADDAWEAAEEIGLPVVVKPQYGNQGRGVSTNLSTREQVARALVAAQAEGSHVVVERYIRGDDHRILVVGDRVVAAARRQPAQVIGDGVRSVRDLVAEANTDPRRSDGHATALSIIKLDDLALDVLTEQGYSTECVPLRGQHVLLRRNGNLSTGGTAEDLSDFVHSTVAQWAVLAAKVIGLDIAGVDVVAEDLSRPLEEQGGGIVEVNAGPGLRMHLEPSHGKPRPVGEAIVDMLFPGEQNGRIPIVAITGVNGKTTTARLIAHLLERAGHFVGLTCTDGLYLNGRRTETRDCSGPQSARAVLLNPKVTAAVLETARGGILREGLGFDQCDVGVVTNIGKGDHFGLRGIETIEELIRVKQTVLEAIAPAGCAVLNADDPVCSSLSSSIFLSLRERSTVTFFTRDASNPVVVAHRALSGRAVIARAGMIVLATGDREEELILLNRVPVTQPGGVAFQVENVLAAVAAAWSLYIPLEMIRRGLETAPVGAGRFNLFTMPSGGTVVVDYAHNPSAVEALVAALEHFPHSRRTLVFAGCNRREIDLVDMGRSAGNAFDRVLLYEDRGNNGCEDGSLNTLLKRGLAEGKRVAEMVQFPDERSAIEAALKGLGADELAVLGVENIEGSVEYVVEFCHCNGEGK